MKSSASILLAFAVMATAHAAGDGWLTSYSEALKTSQKTGKPVLANFTGSDWCAYCKRLDAEVFSTPEFKKWASKYVVLLKLDYPHYHKLGAAEMKEKADLMAKYGVRGFPTIYFLKADGKAFGMYGYEPGGPLRWTAMADRLVNPNLKPKG